MEYRGAHPEGPRAPARRSLHDLRSCPNRQAEERPFDCYMQSQKSEINISVGADSFWLLTFTMFSLTRRRGDIYVTCVSIIAFFFHSALDMMPRAK